MKRCNRRCALPALLLLGLALVGSRAVGQGRALRLEDYFKIQGVGSPAISPDGRLVAFTRSTIVRAENRRHSEIWLAPTDGSRPPRRITSPALSSSGPRWSPDGKLLAFRSSRRLPGKRPGSTWFLPMDGQGGEAFQIPGVRGTPIFSPDGRWIAFTRRTPPPGAGRTKEYESEFVREMHERFKGRVFDWMSYRFDRRGYRPDPRDPAASPPRELWVVARSGGKARQLTRLGVSVSSAVWSPDSRRLALVADTHERDEYTYQRADLWIVDLAGDIRRLTDDGYDNSSPAWSPDGGHLVFRRIKGLSMVIAARQDHGAPVDIYRMPAGGGDMQNLTASWDLRPGRPSWSPDGRSIRFSAGIGGDSHLLSLPAAGGAVRQVTQGERRLRGFSHDASWRGMAYTATDPRHPGEVYVSASNGGGERRISNFNEALLAELALSPARRLAYKSRDGTPIEGWVMPPRGFDESKGPYPLLLCIHGGPHGAYGNSFSFQFQFLAANGYTVLYTNPRGSTGYGEKFLYATWGGWGVLDYQDVMAGVDAALETYPIDRRRLGVTGYSYGGFMTNWVITQTDRFSAAISGAGISNWISDYGTADIPRTKESEFHGPPWEQRSGELLRKLSPITHAGSVATPTMFVHGENDYRVPIEQAEQMYTALKKQRVAARFVRYPDSYHGGWTPWNMIHRYYHELGWWKQHLAPKPTAR